MKTRAVLVFLGMLMFIFCTVGLSQAAYDRQYDLDFLYPPNEHPWQHDDSPGPGDTLEYNLSHMVILPVSPTIKAILLIRIPKCITGPNQEAKDISSSQGDKYHFQGE